MPLLSLDPFSQPEALPLPPTDIPSIISIITSYYTFLTSLPHICPNSLQTPPSDNKGWPDLDESTLRTRLNRSEKAISLLKHLPCLHRPAENPHEDRSVRLSPDTLGIAYHVGEVWDEAMHRQCPTPGNVVWLGKMDGWDGTALLLDVDTGMYFASTAFFTSLSRPLVVHIFYRRKWTSLSHGTIGDKRVRNDYRIFNAISWAAAYVVPRARSPCPRGSLDELSDLVTWSVLQGGAETL